jgi:hypothetical protein
MGKYDRMTTAKSKEEKPIKQIDDPMTPSYHDPKDGGSHEAIRKAVRLVGKETTNYRLSAEEKEALRDLVYAFRKQGLPTSENEIMRIALNLTLTDYSENVGKSALVQVLERLNS